MNKILIPLLILLGSLIYSWFWNCIRKPECTVSEPVAVEQTLAAPDTTVVEVTPPPVLTEEEQVLFSPLDVYFESGKSSISRNAEIDSWLSTAKTYLEKNPNEKLSVTGHTDDDGPEESNQLLSVKRANLVKDILTKEGFGASNLEVFGKGESEPIADNATEEGKSKNRRVSIRLIK
jgi:outer membrane protein OmpA-like peptidoglycan-associated protein